MLVFLLANLPLPIITYLNIMVTLRYLKVRHLSRARGIQPAKPRQLVLGWWLGNISMVFALAPGAYERTIFVQDTRWLLSYGIAATLAITGLLLMNNGLGQELRQLARKPKQRRRR